MAEEDPQDSHSIWNGLPDRVVDEFKTREFLRIPADNQTLINLVKDGESNLRDQATQKGVDLIALQVFIDAVKKAAPERFRVDHTVDLSRVRGFSPLNRSLSGIQDEIHLQSARLSSALSSPGKEGRGNGSLEHVYLKFCTEYVSPAADGPQYADIWDDSWSDEDEMYVPFVAELNEKWDVDAETWERTDQKTMKRNQLDMAHLLFFQTIGGFNMNEKNLRLPDLMLLEKDEKKKKKTEVSDAASIKQRSFGIGFELKRPICRMQPKEKSKKARASGARKKTGKKRRMGDDGSPSRKRRRLEASRSEMSEDDDGDDLLEDAGQGDDDVDVKEDKLFGYFHAVSVAAKAEIHSDLEKLRDVGLSRSKDNGVHSTEAWRRTIHQVATLACMEPSLPAFVVLSDLDPEFCSYLFWLSRLERGENKSLVVCMARVRFRVLPTVVLKLRYDNRDEMLPSAWPAMALKDFDPTPFIPAEIHVPK